jgi:undecaprenyl-diphosphatase
MSGTDAPSPANTPPSTTRMSRTAARAANRPRAVDVVVLSVVAAPLVAIIVLAVAEAGDATLSPAEALLLGAVEGITEYLPISSTGHLTVIQDLLGLTATASAEAAADSYAIAIQLGAIVAVAVLYRSRIFGTIAALTQPADTQIRQEARHLLAALVAAFLPAAVIGVAFGDQIKRVLFGVWPTTIAWLVGGIAIVVFARRHRPGDRVLELITWRDGLIIGCAQVLALWPGVSRSLVTIIAAVAIGLHIGAAVEFSFLLGLATLGAATIYETVDNGTVIVEQYGILTPLAGFAAAVVSAAVAVLWMVSYLQRHSLAIFGWYRIVLAAAIGALALTGSIT